MKKAQLITTILTFLLLCVFMWIVFYVKRSGLISGDSSYLLIGTLVIGAFIARFIIADEVSAWIYNKIKPKG